MATYPSNLVQSGVAPAIVPGASKPVVGRVVVPAGVTIGNGDNMPLYMLAAGGGAMIADLWIQSPALDSGATLSMQLSDTATPVNIIVATSTSFRAGGVIQNAQIAYGKAGMGVMYTTPTMIQLLATAGAGAAIPAGGATIYFIFQVTSG